MRALLLALVLVLAGPALAPAASACHPYHIEEYDLDGATVYYWVDMGCPHTFVPTVCIVIVPDDATLPILPVCG
jgi:hypothetical protein